MNMKQLNDAIYEKEREMEQLDYQTVEYLTALKELTNLQIIKQERLDKKESRRVIFTREQIKKEKK